jgi:hypothetical protein
MSLPMMCLLLGCFGVALAPQAVARLLGAPVAALTKSPVVPLMAQLNVLANLGRAALVILLGLALASWLLIRLRRQRPLTTAETWGCGFAFPTARMAYTAGSYAELTRKHLVPDSLRPEISLLLPQGLFPAAGRVVHAALDPILDRVFLPLFRRFADRVLRLRWLQQGKLPVYLLYIFATCALLLIWSVLAGRGWRFG